MKKFIKWFSVTLAGLLVLTVAFTAIFVVIPLSRSVKNLKEKQNETTSAVTQAVTSAAPAASVTQPAEGSSGGNAQAETTAPAPQNVPAFTEYDVYRTGKFYVKGTVTDKDGETNPMELAVTDDSIYMLTSASGVQMGVMIGGGKTYLVSPKNQMYIELNSMVMSMLGIDSSNLAAPENFNFSDMRPLSDAAEVKDTELNGVKCRVYIFAPAQGKTTYVYLDGTRLLQTDMLYEDGSLYNRMVFDSVSAEVPSDRIAPPTYYNKAGLLKFVKAVVDDLPE